MRAVGLNTHTDAILKFIKRFRRLEEIEIKFCGFKPQSMEARLHLPEDCQASVSKIVRTPEDNPVFSRVCKYNVYDRLLKHWQPDAGKFLAVYEEHKWHEAAIAASTAATLAWRDVVYAAVRERIANKATSVGPKE